MYSPTSFGSTRKRISSKLNCDLLLQKSSNFREFGGVYIMAKLRSRTANLSMTLPRGDAMSLLKYCWFMPPAFALEAGYARTDFFDRPV